MTQESPEEILAQIRAKVAQRNVLKENPLLKEDPPLMPQPTNENLRRYLQLSFGLREETPELLSMFKTIVDNMGAKSQFKAYTWIDEMKDRAYADIMDEWQRYEDSATPYSDIIKLVKQSFYKFLQEEKNRLLAEGLKNEEHEEHDEASEILAAIRERKAEEHKAIENPPSLAPMSLTQAEMPTHSHGYAMSAGAHTHTHSMACTGGYRTEDVVTWSADRLDNLDKQVAALAAENRILNEKVHLLLNKLPVEETKCEPQESPVSDYDRAMGVIE